MSGRPRAERLVPAPVMYSAGKLASRAMRVERPSKTPGAVMGCDFEAARRARRRAGAVRGREGVVPFEAWEFWVFMAATVLYPVKKLCFKYIVCVL